MAVTAREKNCPSSRTVFLLSTEAVVTALPGAPQAGMHVGRGKRPPAKMRPSGSKETALIPTPRGFGPPYPAWRGKPKHTSLGWLELKSPFACLERDNLSDTSCCMLCPLGHTCYCVTACLKNVGCRGKENDCNLACSNNLRAFFPPVFVSVRKGKGGGGKKRRGRRRRRRGKSQAGSAGEVLL